MKDIIDFTATEILAIKVEQPEKLFTVDNLTTEKRRLATKWHPDKCKLDQADQVFAHIQNLFKSAEDHIEKNCWNGPATLQYTTKDGSTFKLKYRRVMELEVGKMYIGMKHLAYVITPDYEDLFRNGIKMINNIKYPKPKFEEQFKRQMPNVIKASETNIGFVVVMEKTDELVLLKDLLDYLPNNKLDPRHVAWIMSTLCNIACFLELNDIAHGAISPSTFWVSPKHHSGVLLGGWWYARPAGEKLLALPAESINILPKEVFVDKVGKTTYDRKLIKALGLECLGDKSHSGSTLLRDSSIPSTVLNWLRGANQPTAVDEYSKWGKARDDGFGPRKFVDLIVDINQIY